MGEDNLVLPTKIPWSTLKGKDLEECLYWLLHSMGARDLEWRVGGVGDGTADQGRDLEATFYSSDPTGDITRQRWWVEAKGRSSTVEKRAVMDAAQNASATSNVDVVLVATNSRFSNPTMDWVRCWNDQHARPKIRLWDHSTLERHLSTNPAVVARLFESALSAQGRLACVQNYFWNYCQLSADGALKQIWNERATLDWNPQSVFAVVASDVASGSINHRAWAAFFSGVQLYGGLAVALVNGPYLLSRAVSMGSSFQHYSSSVAYLLLGMMLRFDRDHLLSLVDGVWSLTDRKQLPEPVRALFLEPILNDLESDLFDLCMDGCNRVSADQFLTQCERKRYGRRLTIQDNSAEAHNQDDESRLIYERKEPGCSLGHNGCPFATSSTGPVADRLAAMQTTARARFGHLVRPESERHQD